MQWPACCLRNWSLLRESKGFRVAREARTFFKDVSAWPQMDFLVQSSVHNCYDTISHELLVNELYEVLGKENLDFIVLLVSFLEAPILDQEGQYYASARIGIPQGCPLSQVLMNFYLNLLDKHFVGFECPLTSWPSNEVRIVPIYYARYANLLLFGFPYREDVVTALASDIVWGTLKKACQYLQVECSWSEINRYSIYIGGRLHNNFEVLGLEWKCHCQARGTLYSKFQ